MKIVNREFIKYKFLNSMFLGLSVGSIFVIYAPLKPSVYSIGGIFLALFILLVAKFYSKILNIEYFFRISLSVEIIMLFLIIFFLLFSYSYTTALVVYISYQATFSFGSYLVRAETMLLKRKEILSFVDIAKQKGYLVGMFGSFVFFNFLEYFFNIVSNKEQIYNLHILLLVVELSILYKLGKSFK